MKELILEVVPSLSEAEFEARFMRIDTDGSGVVEYDEFVTWVHMDEVQVVGGRVAQLQRLAVHGDGVEVGGPAAQRGDSGSHTAMDPAADLPAEVPGVAFFRYYPWQLAIGPTASSLIKMTNVVQKALTPPVKALLAVNLRPEDSCPLPLLLVLNIAVAKDVKPEEQAVSTVMHGPRMPKMYAKRVESISKAFAVCQSVSGWACISPLIHILSRFKYHHSVLQSPT